MTREEELVEGNFKEVYRFALRLLADREAAEELTQVVFERALKALPKFRGDSSPRTWLFAIALNESRRKRPPAPLQLEPDAEERDERPGPEADALTKLDAERLHKLIVRLDDRQREAVVLHYLENLSLEEISEVLESPVNTVKTWLFRGRESLRAMWEKS